MNADIIKKLKVIVGASHVLTDPADTQKYNQEWRNLYEGKAHVVVRPDTTQQVSDIVTLCAAHKIPVVPQGGNTGLVGGQISMDADAALLSLSRMDKIRSFDAEGFSMIAEAGVTVQAAQEIAEKANRLFALSLASEGSCEIGGTVSTNAGGMNALLYGVMRSLVFGLEVVLPDGRIWDGLRSLRKDNSGYDLKQLFIGAEGTLGIVTAASLKLFPLPEVMETAFISVQSTADALALVNLLQDRFLQQLSRCELLPEAGLQLVLQHIPNTRRPLAQASPWYVIIELAAGRETNLREPLNLCLAAGLEQNIIIDAAIAENRQQRKDFWMLREAVSEAQREEGGSIKLDVSVPLARVPDFLARAASSVEQLCPGARPIPFGHLGDGNIHYDICQPPGMDKKDFLKRWDEISDPLHQIVLEFGGSIAAEHGVGAMKRGLIAQTKSPVEIDLMRTLKKALDPHGPDEPRQGRLMAALHSFAKPVVGVSVAVWKNNQVLLAQRGTPPFIGTWSFPGGKVKTGERLEDAASRELKEEAGLRASGFVFVRPVEIILHQADIVTHHIVLSLFTCRWSGEEIIAGDDAKDTRWVSIDEISSLSVTEGLEKYARACWDKMVKDKT